MLLYFNLSLLVGMPLMCPLAYILNGEGANARKLQLNFRPKLLQTTHKTPSPCHRPKPSLLVCRATQTKALTDEQWQGTVPATSTSGA